MDHWIGIDLGTTYTAAALWRDRRVDILQNWADGQQTTPSVVGYSLKGDIIVGNPAIKKASMNLKNTICDAKRLIGLTYSDPKIVKE